jgi:hypothetical protein
MSWPQLKRAAAEVCPNSRELVGHQEGKRINQSLDAVVQAVESSKDPLRKKRLFLIAQPVGKLKKRREDKEGNLKEIYEEKPEYGGSQGRLFERLGLDLLQVTEAGNAVVHGDPEDIERLKSRSAMLDKLGPREQSQWATIDSFQIIPPQLRVDADWLEGLKRESPNEIVIELQPVLTPIEADRVLRAIADVLTEPGSGRLTATGTDFSGRHWFRGKANRASVRNIARDFYSVQAIHSPLYSIAAAKLRRRIILQNEEPIESHPPLNANALPCIAIVDLGIPREHKRLSPYRRSQFYPQDVPSAPVGDHGSFVASRAVFGDHETADGLLRSVGRCSYYDAMVGDYPGGLSQTTRVNDKVVLTAMVGVRGAAPDVRVFNLSFGDTRHLNDFNPIDRSQKRLDLQNLDNFVFATDTIVVVAAGNSQPGVPPSPDYPNHFADPRWALGPWACGFNTLVCGSYVSQLSASSHVKTRGWPSPFTRIGTGLCDAPVPSFSAPGGNTDDTYHVRPGMGVWGYSGSGLTEDRGGTSQAAPILAREAALTLAELQQHYCLDGTQPFGVTARAFLTLTAARPVQSENVQQLVERTLGYGLARVERLIAPAAGSAVILWQGYIESPRDLIRVQVPIPFHWLQRAAEPMLQIVICADPPVNEAAQSTWACRKIHAVLRPYPEGRGVNAPRGGHPTYPTIDRLYRLGRHKQGGDVPAQDDFWLVELSYEEVAPYPPATDFDPRQRVAFAAELIDAASEPLDPQEAMQAIPGVNLMTRLSVQQTAIRSPIIIRMA